MPHDSTQEVWVINPHDALPGELWGYPRGNHIVTLLDEQGYRVRWWAGSFAHALKQHRKLGEAPLATRSTLHILATPRYARHVGAGRLLNYAVFSYRLLRAARRAPSPPAAIIFMGPTPFIDAAASLLTRRWRVPLVMEFRDLWPELFLMALPQRIRHWGKPLLLPFLWLRNAALKVASAVLPLNESYRSYVPANPARTPQQIVEVVYNGIDVDQIRAAPASGDELETKLRLPIKANSDERWAIHVGALNMNSDVRTVWQCAEELHRRGCRNVRVLMTGDGPLRPELEEFLRTHPLPNFAYVGALEFSDLCALMQRCDIGICAYSNASTVAFPTKALEYVAAGLALVHSLQGEFENFVAGTAVGGTESLGTAYRAENPYNLADVLEALAQDSPQLSRYRQASRAVGGQFDWRQQYAIYPRLIKALTGI
jgi:glycosyltransferase involved in cell wall biosynthesis